MAHQKIVDVIEAHEYYKGKRGSGKPEESYEGTMGQRQNSSDAPKYKWRRVDGPN